jgi:hypothetical protein
MQQLVLQALSVMAAALCAGAALVLVYQQWKAQKSGRVTTWNRAKPLDGLLRDFAREAPMPHLPAPNPVRPGPGPGERLRNLQARFRAVSTRHDRPNKLRIMIAGSFVIAALAVAWGLYSSPWPVTTTLRHLTSAISCERARWVGLAPARYSQPGYWKHLDRDQDGIACEPW